MRTSGVSMPEVVREIITRNRLNLRLHEDGCH